MVRDAVQAFFWSGYNGDVGADSFTNALSAKNVAPLLAICL